MHDVDFGGLTLSMSHFTTCTGMNVHATENPATVTRTLKIMYIYVTCRDIE